MTTHEFARWMEPIAGNFRETRAKAMSFARSLSNEQLETATGDTGWSVRDELAHMSGSDGDFLRVLGAILQGETPDTSVFGDIDARNVRNLAARAAYSIEDIAKELESNGEALQELLSRLTDEDETRQPDGIPFALSAMVGGYAQHDAYHVGQIREAVQAK